MIDYNAEIHEYYLDKCRAVVGSDAVVLKTDLWNEVRLDVPGSGAIVGNVGGVKKWYVVEVAEQRLDCARGLFDNQDVTIIAGRIQDVEFKPEMFDAIMCLGTANYMGFPSCVRTLLKFKEWIKPEGKIYISAWLWDGKNTEKDSDKPGERFYHNAEEFERVLGKIFRIDEREVITAFTVQYRQASLVGYKCSP